MELWSPGSGGLAETAVSHQGQGMATAKEECMGLVAEETDTGPNQGIRRRADTWLPGDMSSLDGGGGPFPSTLAHLSWGGAWRPGGSHLKGAAFAADSPVALRGHGVLGEVPRMRGIGWAQAQGGWGPQE